MATSYYIGLDPGLTGAIAVIDPGGNVIGLHDIPTVKQDGKTRLDLRELYTMLNEYFVNCVGDFGKAHAVLERQQPMPRQGVSSTFQTGRGYGNLEAVLTCVGMSFETVAPAKWKRSMGVGNDKGGSIILAMQLFPKAHDLLARKKDHNRAEALLLAEFLRRTVRA